MKLPAIIISDPHFTASPNDEYRWGLWPWLAKELEAERAKTLLILGDLTDAKDYHPAELVNRLTQAIVSMPVDEIIILAGNHDWLKQGGVFFQFLNCIKKPRIRVIVKPEEDLGADDSDPTCMFLPYSKQPARDWQGLDFSHFDYLFLHQTVKGAVASNGQKMDGEELPPLNAAKVYSGDIHVPQIIGSVEYVGSPYHVHFGDAFKPRALLIDKKRQVFDLHFKSPARIAVKISSVDDLDRVPMASGDQVKVAFQLDVADAHRWNTIRRSVVEELRSKKVELHGIKMTVQRNEERLGTEPSAKFPVQTPEQSLYRFVASQELGSDLLDIGLEIIEK